MNKKFFILIAAMFLSLRVEASTYFWSDCSLPVYAFPYNLEKSPVVLKNLNDQWIKNYIQKKRIKRKEIELQLAGMPNLDIDLSDLSDAEAKKLAEQAFGYLESKNKMNSIPNYPEEPPEDFISQVRLLLVIDIFKKSGEEVKLSENIKANYSPHYSSLCEFDNILAGKVSKKTLENINNGSF